MPSAIKTLRITSPKIVSSLYQLMRDTHTILSESGVKYWAIGGTFLGLVRHRGMIPWDDDIDIAIENIDVSRFLSLRPFFKRCDLVVVRVWLGFKIFHRDSPMTGRHKYGFPNIDVFPMRDVDGVLHPLYKRVREVWPKEYYPSKSLYPLKLYEFADFKIYGPASHKSYFKRTYGDDWNSVAYRDYDHELEEEVESVVVHLKPHDRTPAVPIKTRSRRCLSTKYPVPHIRNRLVVSLTTIPDRINVLYKTVVNILRQTQPIDAVYLNIPRYSTRGEPYTIPDRLQRLADNSDGVVVINRRAIDVGPGTKLYPTLLRETNPSTIICTIDDDMIYDRRMIETLVREYLRDSSRVIGYYGWNIGPRGKMWDLDSVCSGDNIDIIEGFGGALYSRRFFMDRVDGVYVDQSSDFISMMDAAPECFFVDDVYISAWLAKSDVGIFLATPPKNYIRPQSHSESQSALSDNPAVERRNARCAMSLVKYFKHRGKSNCYNKGGYAWE